MVDKELDSLKHLKRGLKTTIRKLGKVEKLEERMKIRTEDKADMMKQRDTIVENCKGATNKSFHALLIRGISEMEVPSDESLMRWNKEALKVISKTAGSRAKVIRGTIIKERVQTLLEQYKDNPKIFFRKVMGKATLANMEKLWDPKTNIIETDPMKKMDILLGFWKEELFSSKVAESHELPPWMDEPTVSSSDWDRELTKEITLEEYKQIQNQAIFSTWGKQYPSLC